MKFQCKKNPGCDTLVDPIMQALPAAIAHWDDELLCSLAQEFGLEEHAATDSDPFVSLCRSIIHQQVSMAAASTIFGRFKETVGELTPRHVLRSNPDDLRAAGLSMAKVSYVIDLAERVNAGLDLRFASETDMEITSALTAIKGIGPWSAKMFMMFHLGRLDVCPHEDLGIRLAVAQFYGVPEKEAGKWLKTKASEWAPYNSVAARVLWRARRLSS